MQWGGPTLFADGALRDARRQGPLRRGDAGAPAEREGQLTVSTRRGKQFNSMVQRDVDPLTGAARDDILISGDDLTRLRLADGARVTLRSRARRLHAAG